VNFPVTVSVSGRGLYDVTHKVTEIVGRCDVTEGIATVFIRHTSASLVIQENADADVRRDLETFFDRLVPEGRGLYRHEAEGPDDMPAHIKSALTATSLSIPIVDGTLALGTWQGIYLWEHRDRRATRELIVNVR
jgi:secondary thiamine-phosphate synthase enzyme